MTSRIRTNRSYDKKTFARTVASRLREWNAPLFLEGHKTLNLHLFLAGTKHSVCTCSYQVQNTQFAPVPSRYKTLSLYLFLSGTKHSICTCSYQVQNTQCAPVPIRYKTLNVLMFLPGQKTLSLYLFLPGQKTLNMCTLHYTHTSNQHKTDMPNSMSLNTGSNIHIYYLL